MTIIESDILTESQINELEDKYKSIDNNKELASDFSPMSHDLDEYHNELAKEFADESLITTNQRSIR
jgi:hypothetical protein